MDGACLEAHGRWVVRAGALLFLLAALLGFVVPRLAIPRLGLSAHLLGVMQSLLLLASGQLWGRLALTPALSRVASGLLVGGCFSAWVANVLAGAWGAGGRLLPIAGGTAVGSALEELILLLLLRGGGLAIIAGWALISWGLRSNQGALGARRAVELEDLPGLSAAGPGRARGAVVGELADDAAPEGERSRVGFGDAHHPRAGQAAPEEERRAAPHPGPAMAPQDEELGEVVHVGGCDGR